MLVPFLIMVREGVEAALIVGIIAGYLRQTGRSQWMPLVWIGIAVAALLCLGLGIALDLVSADFPQRQQELFSAVVGFVAVAMLTSMVFWMRKAARSIKGQLHDSIDAALKGSNASGLALVAMVFFAVAREGLESVFFLLATFQQASGLAAPLGAVAGLLVAVGVGLSIYWGTLRLDLRRFFRWTGAFILIVAAGLLAGSLRSLHEAGLWNGLQQIAFDISPVLPLDSPLGSVLGGIFGYQDAPTLGEIGLYLCFLVVTLPLFLIGSNAPRRLPSNA
ncbi:iron uptake transporter permease EfeU [Labrys wisconsinensis]|uniref:High-affinity iron transporter n=1 Tax=Labrys wisconsinensis TaxID=425677 RepID=A0ABU0JHT7_9HYPH|nr:iron uptake transporter permease EfeU [Labrys wisconsinensis]MDQ0472682.1 high-affinity iron transporter [Labrys wisconsinensis]